MESQEGSDDAADEAAAAKEEEEELKTKVSGKTRGLWKLYISRALTAWGDRLWNFGLGLFLLHVRTVFPVNNEMNREHTNFWNAFSIKLFRCGLKTY